MKIPSTIIILLLLMGGVGVGGFWYGRHSATKVAPQDGSDAGDAEDVQATPTVKVLPIRSGTISRTIVAYGTVVAEPSEIHLYSVPYESRVSRVLVMPGQPIAANTPMVEISPSVDAQLQYRQALSAVDTVKRDLSQTQEKFDSHLATEQELLQSRQNLEQAQLKLDSMEKNGAGGEHQLLSDAEGIISKLDVQVGGIVSAGAPIIETIPENKFEVRLGIEPEDAALLNERMKDSKSPEVKITLVHADDPTPMIGAVQLVSHRVNPDTRLVDVFVALNGEISLPLETFVRGELTISSDQGLIVPRNSVLPDDEGNLLFTVKDGHAVKHVVTIGLRNDREVEVAADKLAAGDLAVVEGNLELEDGMPVNAVPAESPTTGPAATEPSTEPADTQPSTKAVATGAPSGAAQ